MRPLANTRLPMGRLPQLVGQAALPASVLAGGGSLLNAGGAMVALNETDTFPPYPLYSCRNVG
ncbi:MAG: hypothetical protein ACKO28_04655 [Cyanobium sp.]